MASVEPKCAQFPANGGVVSLTVTNPTGDRLAFKVKSSNNALFTVGPVYGFVNPGENATIQVTSKGPLTKEEKKIVQFINAAGVSDAAVAFNGKTPQSSVTVQCVMETAAPAPAPEQDPNMPPPDAGAVEQGQPEEN